MNPQEAHQIANPEILKLLEGCGCFYNGVTEFDKCFSLTKETGIFLNNLCPICENKLKGILIAQEKELEFLNEISKWHEEFSVAYIKMVDERREALKISCEDLRKVLK